MTTEIAAIVAETILVLFIYIALGFLMRKINIIDDKVNQGLASIFMITSLPASILNSMFNQPFDQGMLVNIAIVFISIVVIYFMFAFVGLGVGKLFNLPRPRIGVYAMAMSFGNIGIMGFPVISALWGGLGLFFASIATLAYFVMLPTLGVWLTVKSAEGSDGQPVKYSLKPNLALVASLIGLAFYITQDFLPVALIHFIRPAVVDGVGGGALARVIGGTAATMTPISMFMIGALLAKGKPADLIGEKETLVLAVVKLLVAPIGLFFVIRMFIDDPVVLGVLVILSAMPAASLAAVYAEKYGADSAFGSRAVFFTTVVSLITIPLVALLLG